MLLKLNSLCNNQIIKKPKADELPVQLDKGAIMPTRAHPEDAGLDLYTPYPTTVPATGHVVIDTGVHVEIPERCAGVLVSKSGLNVKYGVTSTGLIDSGYTGSIKVRLENHSHQACFLPECSKITQLVIIPILTPEPVLVEEVTGGERGNNGFGSTETVTAASVAGGMA